MSSRELESVEHHIIKLVARAIATEVGILTDKKTTQSSPNLNSRAKDPGSALKKKSSPSPAVRAEAAAPAASGDGLVP